MIEEYLEEFGRRLVGPAERVAEIRAELAAHLYAAEEAGELEASLARLGLPSDAAAVLSEPFRAAAVPLRRRSWATAIDLVPLLLATAARAVLDIRLDGHGIVVLFPPLVQFGTGTSTLGGLLVVAGLSWSVLGLAVLEARSGRTPGKAMMGLRVLDKAGGPITLRQAVLRRASLLAGPLAWVDYMSALSLHGQRLTERWSNTVVVTEQSAGTRPRERLSRLRVT